MTRESEHEPKAKRLSTGELSAIKVWLREVDAKVASFLSVVLEQESEAR